MRNGYNFKYDRKKRVFRKIKKWKDKDSIKVVTGIRRCGKSTLFELYIDYKKT